MFGKKIHLRCASYSYATKTYMTKCSKIYSGTARSSQTSKMERSAKIAKRSTLDV